MRSTVIMLLMIVAKISVAQNNVFPSTGNVGVGTVNPLAHLQVQKTSAQPAFMIGGGNSGSPRLQIYGLSEDPKAWMGLGADMGGANYEHSIYFPEGDDNYKGILTFGDYNGLNYNVRMSILASGNVGIGTTTPLAKLDVNGHQLLNGNLMFANEKTDYFIKAYGNGGAIRIRSNSVADVDRNVQFGNIDNNGSWNSYMIVASSGNVGIGTATPQEKLSVNGKIRAKEIKVEAGNWPDYVFEQGYKIEKLEALEHYIKTNKHLPGIPSAEEVKSNGFNLGEMNKLLLKKIEELTLYLIEKDKEIKKIQQHQKFFLKEKKGFHKIKK